MDPHQGYCQIGIHATQGESNEYRLGTIFLRNFYTALDYDADLIAIGVNRGSAQLAKATLVGHRANPLIQPKRGSVAGIFILVILVVLATVAAVFFILRRRDLAKKKAQEAAQQVVDDQDKTESNEDADGQDGNPGYEGANEQEGEDNNAEDTNEIQKSSNYLVRTDAIDQEDEAPDDEEEEAVAQTQVSINQ